MSMRDERLVSSRFRKSPVHSSPFGSSTRTVLPPLSSPFQAAEPASENPLGYSRMSPSRNDLFSPSFDSHWSNNNHMMAGHHQYPYSPFEVDQRYSTSSPQSAVPMPQSLPLVSQPLEHHYNGVRRGPPLNIPHVQQDSGYLHPPPQPNYGLHSFADVDIHSPSSSYPIQYGEYVYPSTYTPSHGSGYDPRLLLVPHRHLHLPPDINPPPHPPDRANDSGGHTARSESYPFEDALNDSRQKPSLIDFPTVKKKRKHVDAAQLKILNEVYNRTAFPTSDERVQLAKVLDMSARRVQIWFQNKRQASRQNRNSVNALPPMVHHPYKSWMPSSSNMPIQNVQGVAHPVIYPIAGPPFSPPKDESQSWSFGPDDYLPGSFRSVSDVSMPVEWPIPDS